MATPNVNPVSQPTSSSADPARLAAIAAARVKQQNTLNSQNTAARQAAIKKKGTQNYSYKTIQGNSDFGAGNAGPGIPYSIKSANVSEKLTKPGAASSAADAAKVAAAKAKNDATKPKGVPLWPVTGNMDPMKAVDWRQAAIRRRLDNG